MKCMETWLTRTRTCPCIALSDGILLTGCDILLTCGHDFQGSPLNCHSADGSVCHFSQGCLRRSPSPAYPQLSLCVHGSRTPGAALVADLKQFQHSGGWQPVASQTQPCLAGTGLKSGAQKKACDGWPRTPRASQGSSADKNTEKTNTREVV